MSAVVSSSLCSLLGASNANADQVRIGEFFRFLPGLTDSGERFVPISKNFDFSLKGPDYTFESPKNPAEAELFYSRVLSLGHGGTVIVKVPENSMVSAHDGPEFRVFENVFSRLNGTTFEELAYVGVSLEPSEDSVTWFQCNTEKGADRRGCAGATPTAEGGDFFDLSNIGVTSFRYVWIRDTSINKNFKSSLPTEGADIDAVEIL